MATHFTPTQRRLMRLLRDGEAHRRDELMLSLDEEYRTRQHLNFHLHYLRRKVHPYGYGIICELKMRSIHYRLVKLVGDGSFPKTL